MATAYIEGVKGLNTETPITSADPSTLFDCSNVVFSKEIIGRARHGHQPTTVNVSFPYTSSIIFKDVKSSAKYDIDNTNYYAFAYKNSSDPFGIDFATVESRVSIAVGTSSQLDSSYTVYDKLIYTEFPGTNNRFQTVNTYPNLFTHDERLYINTDYGTYTSPSEVTADTEFKTTVFPNFGRGVHATLQNRLDLGINVKDKVWLSSGNKVGLRFVMEQETKSQTDTVEVAGSRRISSHVSVEDVVFFYQSDMEATRNDLEKCFILATIPVGYALPNSYVKVYRTKQVPANEPLPVEYFLAAQETAVPNNYQPFVSFNSTNYSAGVFTVTGHGFSDGDYVRWVPNGGSGQVSIFSDGTLVRYNTLMRVRPLTANTFTLRNIYNTADVTMSVIDTGTQHFLKVQAFELTLNDDGIIGLEQLYTTVEGAENENIAPIPAKNVTQKDGYFIYSDILKNATQTFALVNPDVDELNYSLAATTGVGMLSNSAFLVDTPETLNRYALVDATVGKNGIGEMRLYVSSGTGYFIYYHNYLTLNADLTNQNLFIRPGNNPGQVPVYALAAASGHQYSTSSGDIRNIRIVPSSGNFDASRFDDIGVFALVSVSTGNVRGLFTYKNIIENPATGQVEFEECQSFGQTFPAIAEFNNAAIYFIPGSTPTSLPFYLTFGSGGADYNFSLLPGVKTLQDPIAVVNFTGNSSPYSVSGGNLRANLTQLGLQNRSPAQTLENISRDICRAINEGDIFFENQVAVVRCRKNDEVGTFTLEIVFPQYQIISARAFGVIGAPNFIPALTNSFQVLAKSERIPEGIVISKQNNPESIPLRYILDPIRIGQSKKEILNVAINVDEAYALKSEGIYRLNLAKAGLIPQVDAVITIDPTTFTVASRSVVEINEGIYFLSQKGFGRIVGGEFDFIGRPIEKEVKTLLSKATTASTLQLISAVGNEFKRLYICTLRWGLGKQDYTTYVYDIFTGKWAKWSIDILTGFTDAVGKMTTVNTDYGLLLSGNYTAAQLNAFNPTTRVRQYITQDIYTDGDPENELDQYDFKLSFGMASISVNGSGELVISSATLSTENDLSRFATNAANNRMWFRGQSGRVYRITFIDSSRSGGLSILRFGSSTDEVIPPSEYAVTSLCSLVVGVNFSLSFNPFIADSSASLKQWQELHVNTEESVTYLETQLKTDSVSGFTNPRIFQPTELNAATNRTIYRTYCPLQASRGRFLFRKVNHSKPFELVSVVGQSLIYRPLSSVRNQMDRP